MYHTGTKFLKSMLNHCYSDITFIHLIIHENQVQ